MVASGLGCSILPGLTVSDVRSDIKGVRLYPPVRRQLGIGAFSFNSLTPAANRFITYLKKVASEIELED